MNRLLTAVLAAMAAFLAGCALGDGAANDAGTKLLAAGPAEFCAEAQHLISRTDKTGEFVVHPDFKGFVESKTSIDPLTLHVHAWAAPDDPGRIVAISCKMKSADHLNAAFGPGTAGPDGLCQDMNRETLRQVRAALPGAAGRQVVLDPGENVFNEQQPARTGADWLAPFLLTTEDAAGTLTIHSKGFRVDWLDPRFARMDARVRGVHYCHLVAPAYLRDLLAGRAKAGVTIGGVYTPPVPPRQ
ncbi:MAG: hypothetical protein FJ170_00515 [Gammaproteobacteria bacterium]|nr:hypothetical protein [Gammaproteobacteria bacterium]